MPYSQGNNFEPFDLNIELTFRKTLKDQIIIIIIDERDLPVSIFLTYAAVLGRSSIVYPDLTHKNFQIKAIFIKFFSYNA